MQGLLSPHTIRPFSIIICMKNTVLQSSSTSTAAAIIKLHHQLEIHLHRRQRKKKAQKYSLHTARTMKVKMLD